MLRIEETRIFVHALLVDVGQRIGIAVVLAKSDIFSDFRSVRFDCFLERFDPQIEI